MALGMDPQVAVTVRRGWLRAAGIGLLASVTTFSVLANVWQPGVGRSRVQAALVYEPGEPATALDLDAVRAQLTSATALQEALKSSGESTDSANVAAWQAQLSVHRAYDGTPSSSERVLIELPTQHEATAIAVVGALSQRFLSATLSGGWASADVKQLAAARQATSAALAKEDIARRELDAATRQQLEHLRHAAQTPAATIPAARRQENPAWQQQQTLIAQLEQQREKLLLTLTTEHPKVRDLEVELEELQSRQSSLPRYLDGPAMESPAPQLLSSADPQVAEFQQRITAAQDAYATARAARLEAQAAVEVLERSTAEASVKQPRFLLAQSAQAVAREAAIAPWTRYSVFTLASMLVLTATTLLLRPRNAPQLLQSVDDIHKQLHVPVVARLRLSRNSMV